MPLPPALAAKLAKRGLVDVDKSKEKSSGQPPTGEYSSPSKHKKSDVKEGQEEVIAEDYDDQNDSQEPFFKNDKRGKSSDSSDDSSSEGSYKKFKGHIGCPNKINIYHDCTKFCEDHWKEGKRVPDLKYLRRKSSMLAKYPLPNHWKEIYDPGLGVHYYWEVDSDAVSWLPPSHPRAVITQSAAVERQQRYRNQTNKENTNSDTDTYSRTDTEDSSSEDEHEAEKRWKTRKLKLEAQENTRAKGRNKLKSNNLDPMDPASYSDIPRGGWSDGLFKGNEAKTGVDVTVSGPLYQMRPYPSPGAVLRANADQKKPRSKK